MKLHTGMIDNDDCYKSKTSNRIIKELEKQYPGHWYWIKDPKPKQEYGCGNKTVDKVMKFLGNHPFAAMFIMVGGFILYILLLTIMA